MLLKNQNFLGNEPENLLKNKRNQQEFEKVKKEIQKLKKQQQTGKIDLFYFDESGFSLDPIVPGAIQPIGETIEIPASKSRKRLNVLGLYSYCNTCRINWFSCMD